MSVISTISLLFRPQRGVIDDITFDAVIRENHDLQSDVSDHNIEPDSSGDGLAPASVSDNVRRKPDIVTLDVIVSNTPVTALGAQLIKGLSALAESTARSNFLDANDEVINGPSREAFNKIGALRDKKKIVEVVTQFKVYKNMLVSGISITSEGSQGSALWATITCKQANLVGALIVEAPKIAKGKGKSNKGQQNTTTPDSQKEVKSRSIVDNLFGG